MGWERCIRMGVLALGRRWDDGRSLTARSRDARAAASPGAIVPPNPALRRTPSRTFARSRRRAQVAAACPRCAQPVIRRSSTANNSYIAIAITPITNSPANTSGIRIDEPADIIR